VVRLGWPICGNRGYNDGQMMHRQTDIENFYKLFFNALYIENIVVGVVYFSARQKTEINIT
jgi:hypothetical protein